MVGPVVVGALALGSCAILAVVDPAAGPPLCPLKALTGLDCPFCGGLRGTHALLQGDVSGALNQNVLLPFIMLGAVTGWVAWINASWQGRPVRVPGGRAAAVAMLVLLVGFAVVRNLPGVAFLPSGPG